MAIIEDISEYLKKYDRILLLIDIDITSFCKSEALKNTTKKVLILSNADIDHTNHMNHSNCAYRRLTGEELEALQRMYNMYEFSDRFQVLSDSPQYGGLLNYVKTGLMTEEDVFQALLYSRAL